MSVKNQLKFIFQNLCYKAYGQLISTQIQSLGNSKYKVNIANDLYHHYQRQAFRFSEPGATPKQIAQDIQLHFYGISSNIRQAMSHQLLQQNRIIGQKRDLNLQIDEFGNFKVKIQPFFQQRVIDQIIVNRNFSYANLKDTINITQNLSNDLAKVNRDADQSYIFCISNSQIEKQFDFSLSYYRIWHYLSMMIKQRAIQKKKVKTYKYFMKQHETLQQSQSIKIQQVSKILGLKIQKMNFIHQYQLLLDKNSQKQAISNLAGQNYIGCLRNEKLFFEKHFNKIEHRLVTFSDVFPQSLSISKLKQVKQVNQQSFNKLNHLFSIIQPNIPIHFSNSIKEKLFHKMIISYQEREAQIIAEKMKQNGQKDWPLGSKIILFGDLLSQFDFSTAAIVLRWIQNGLQGQRDDSRNRNCYNILKQSFNKIVFHRQ